MYVIFTAKLFRQLNVRLWDVLLPEGNGQVTVNHATDSHAYQQVRLRFMQLNYSNTM
jgi:hypothetical protein